MGPMAGASYLAWVGSHGLGVTGKMLALPDEVSHRAFEAYCEPSPCGTFAVLETQT